MNPPAATPQAASPTVAVWGLGQRLGHWLLAGSVIGCWVLHEGGPWHVRLGYLALGIALLRTLAGALGPPPMRFGAFVRSVAATLAYTRMLRDGAAPRYLNHNPLGAWMVLALLVSALVAGGSGALYDTDAFWGDPLVWAVHQVSAWAFVALVPLHLAGVLLSSRAHRENLVWAMITGRKRAPARH